MISLLVRSFLVGVAASGFLAEGKLNEPLFEEQIQRHRKTVEEWKPCVPFSDPAVQGATGAVDDPWGTYSPECDTNDCPGGCCRFHTHVLHCDEDDDYPHQPVSEIGMSFVQTK